VEMPLVVLQLAAASLFIRTHVSLKEEDFLDADLRERGSTRF